MSCAGFQRESAAPGAADFIGVGVAASALGAAFGRRAERRREFLARSLRRDAFDVVPVFLARIDRVVAVFVLVRFVGSAGAGNRVLGQLDERAFFGVAAIDVEREAVLLA